MRPAIRVENLSKYYRLGGQQEGGYRTLRESLAEAARAPWSGVRRLARPACRENNAERAARGGFWALDDVSFEVQPGEVVGVIGRNGAGKSTLLKILSRITEPTRGRAEVRGRVGSLLEVGTGFHNELTGRENIYLSGAILGMSRHEINRKFDDIVEFAEIGPFLDTPIKRYSSGMYVRLAFSVATCMETEMLVVDEVLAVGDVAFQKRCLERMEDLGRHGKTILFVTHNMGIVTSLCQSAITLDQGRVQGYGGAREQVREYMARLGDLGKTDLAARTDRTGNGAARVTSIGIFDISGRPVESALAGESLVIRFGYEARRSLGNLEIHAWICDEQGARITVLSSRFTGDLFRNVPARGCFECTIPEISLAPGNYMVDVFLENGLEQADYVLGAAPIRVDPGPFFASGRTPKAVHGVVLTHNKWILT